MTDPYRDRMLLALAQHRGLRLVKSRRRKRGGDFGRFGLADLETGKPRFGFGEDGLTATAEEIEAHLRGEAEPAWKESLSASKPSARTRANARK